MRIANLNICSFCSGQTLVISMVANRTLHEQGFGSCKFKTNTFLSQQDFFVCLWTDTRKVVFIGRPPPKSFCLDSQFHQIFSRRRFLSLLRTEHTVISTSSFSSSDAKVYAITAQDTEDVWNGSLGRKANKGEMFEVWPVEAKNVGLRTSIFVH